MASTDTDASPPELQFNATQELTSASLANMALQDDASQPDNPDIEKPKPNGPPRPLMVYTPTQILYLHKSPLVQSPKGMPDLKDWFGTENEQNLSKKDSESAQPVSNARDRRFRRDLEDGETTSRPSFRSALSQPSQMGNFKHQSLRAPDRDLRDKEGHEHLRNLSDKYDRDRLGSNNRAKDRDAAPHLSAGSSRLPGQGQSSATASRRADTRDSSKRSDDWRRVSDRGSKDDRSDTSRRDREGRERPRSRVRDSSRPRRDPSAPRRDRDRARDDHPYDRYRDEYRYDSYEKDTDRGSEHEDPRRWRDDGRRDERLSARRMTDRNDREPRVREYDSYRPGSDDSRGKRQPPRDRKLNGADEKERDDRRDREREKEKEPAWMDTYIPSPTNGGILGGKGDELDGIQAWKKDMKEKQEKGKPAVQSLREDAPPTVPPAPASTLVSGDNGLDEIQMFRMLMKQEEEKKKQAETTDDSAVQPTVSLSSASHTVDKPISPTSKPGAPAIPTPGDSPNTLLAMLTQANSTSSVSKAAPPAAHLDHPSSIPKVYSNPQTSVKPPEPSTLVPPPGSRLLAFATRSPTIAAPKSQSPVAPSPQTALESSILVDHSIGPQTSTPSAISKTDALGPTFSPFDEANGRSVKQEAGDPGFHQMHNPLRRVSAERASLPPADNGHHLDIPFPSDTSASVALASSKGSRFAKFFDGNKNRDPAIARAQPSPSTLPAISRGDDVVASNSPMNGNPDNRAIVEIFNMLHNSVQGRSLNGMDQPLSLNNHAQFSHQQQAQTNLQMLQPQLQHSQIPLLQPGNRLDSLYDSRLDDRSFVPDGMVPGLRNAPLSRTRDNGMFPESIDDLHFARQRGPSQRGPDHMFPGQIPVFSQQNRNAGPPLQQPHFRGGPSPIPLQNQLHNPVQRLPPGLANLGARPPHEPNQYLGMQNTGLMNSLHGNGLSQPPFNNIPGSNSVGFGGPPLRGPLAPSPIQNNMGIGHPNNMDMRHQAHLMGIGGIGGVRNGVGFNQGPGQIQPLMGMRQQQPPIPLPHQMAQGLPAHLQQQGLPPSNPPNHDLMALLMSGHHRE